MSSLILDIQDFSPIILSIHPTHAERIFDQTKVYELRKAIPAKPFNVVFLYESNIGVIKGFFLPKKVLTAPVERLWDIVGKAVTTRERFDKYFINQELGYAIEIETALRLDITINLKIIPTSTGSKLYISPNFVYVHDHLTKEFLYHFYRRSFLPLHEKVSLELAQYNDYEIFKEFIMKTVDKTYEDVGEDYAVQLWNSHQSGSEENGFMSLAKEIYRVKSLERHIGYAVLTFKRGGSLKSGPVFLFEEFQNQGYGKKMREAIEDIALSKGVRKIYCTVATNNRPGVSYLLSSSYKIEAHLTNHYRKRGDELVFGKILYYPNANLLSPTFVSSVPNYKALILRRAEGSENELVFYNQIMAKHYGFNSDSAWYSRLLLSPVEAFPLSYQFKPRRVYILENVDNTIYGIFICALKRSNMVKVFPLLTINDVKMLKYAIREIEVTGTFRKITFFVSPFYEALYEVLKQQDYLVEGILRGPYSPRNDLMILSKTV